MSEELPRRPRAPKGDGARLREDILAASTMLLEHATVEPSVRAIAQEVGVSPAAIYLHFPDKSTLLHEAASRKVFTALDGLRSDADLATVVGTLLTIAEHSPVAYRLAFLNSPSTVGGVPRPVYAAYNAVRAAVARTAPAVDVDLLSAAVVGATTGFTTLALADPVGPWPSLDRLGGLLSRLVEGAFDHAMGGASPNA
jgi:AcrR family transcriptional regulator